MTSSPLLQNAFTLRRPRVTRFADIIEIITMFIKNNFKSAVLFGTHTLLYKSLRVIQLPTHLSNLPEDG